MPPAAGRWDPHRRYARGHLPSRPCVRLGPARRAGSHLIDGIPGEVPTPPAGAEGTLTAKLTIDSPFVRVEGVDADSPEEAFASAREVAERFLDGVSRDCEDVDLAITSAEIERRKTR